MRDLTCQSADHQFIQELCYLVITYIRCLFLEAFLVIGSFHRPRQQTGHFNRAVLADKDILRTDISYFFALAVEKVCC